MQEFQEGPSARLLTYFATALLALSLLLPVYCHQNDRSHIVYGFQMLALGLLGPAIGQFGWLGNIALPICGLTQWRWMRLICLLAFFNSLFWRHDNGDPLLWSHTNGAIPASIDHLVGYYVWMAAMAIAGFALLLPVKRPRSRDKELGQEAQGD